MTDNDIAVALARADESQKAAFAEFLTVELDDLLGQDDAVKRRVIAAFDRYAAEKGAA